MKKRNNLLLTTEKGPALSVRGLFLFVIVTCYGRGVVVLVAGVVRRKVPCGVVVRRVPGAVAGVSKRILRSFSTGVVRMGTVAGFWSIVPITPDCVGDAVVGVRWSMVPGLVTGLAGFTGGTRVWLTAPPY